MNKTPRCLWPLGMLLSVLLAAPALGQGVGFPVVPTPVSVANGGTGGETPAEARTNLGLGTTATLNIGDGLVQDGPDLELAPGPPFDALADGTFMGYAASASGGIRTSITSGETFELGIGDTDDAVHRLGIVATAGNTPTLTIGLTGITTTINNAIATLTSLTVQGVTEIYVGGTKRWAVDSSGFLKPGASATLLFPFAGQSFSSPDFSAGQGLSFYSGLTSETNTYAFAYAGGATTTTSGASAVVALPKSFTPTSGSASNASLLVNPTINQTGGANGATRGIHIAPALTAAADWRGLEVDGAGIAINQTNAAAINSFAGDMRFSKTITAGGTTGAQTINKTCGSVNFAAAATSLVVTNSLVTANSVIIATVATNDGTMKSVLAVAGAGSFTLHANAAATAETRVNFLVIN